MDDLHRFRVVAWWASGRTGIAKAGSAPNAIHFTSPPAFGGLEGRWTPEDLLLCAIASCYTTTFRAVAEHSKFEYTDLQVEAEGSVSKEDAGYSFGGLVIRAQLTISREADEPQATKLLHKAEDLCLVARALSVRPKFEPTVRISEPRANVIEMLPASAHE